jgi:hypothetical protein
LRVYDAWSGHLTSIDLVSRRILGSVLAIPTRASLWLPGVQDAFAKGPNHAATLSADGQRLFVTGPHDVDGVFSVDALSLAVGKRMLPNTSISEVWIGGDGSLLAFEQQTGNRLHILDSGTGALRTMISTPGELIVP